MSRLAIVLAVSILTCAVARGQWVHLGPDGGEADTLVFHPSNPSIMYAGSPAGVRKSTDGGATWVDADAGIPEGNWILGLAIDSSGSLYAGGDGVWKSTDDGASWVRLLTGLPLSVHLVGFHEPMAVGGDGAVYVNTSVGLYKTTNGGASWTQIAGGATDIEAVLPDPRSSSALLYVGTDSGLSKSTDGGVTITPVSTGVPPGNNVEILAAAATNPPTVFAGYSDLGVYRSTDDGASWSASNTGLPGPNVGLVDVAADPTTPTTVWAALDTTVYRSADAGLTWSATAFPSGEFIATLTAGPGGCVGVGTYGHAVLRSCDGGATWTNGVAGYHGVDVGGFWQDSIAADPTAPGAFHIATGSGIFHTTDGGTTWIERTSHPTRGGTVVAVAPSDPAIVYTFGVQPGARSTDGGATWASCGPLPAGFLPLAMALAIDPADPNVVYVTMYSGGPLARSTDGCASFALVPIPAVPGDFGWSVAVDPTDSQRILLATFGGIFESTDGGSTWTSAWPGSSNLVRFAPDGTAFASANGNLIRRAAGDVAFHLVLGVPGIGFSGFAIDPVRPSRVFIGGTGSSAMFFSHDGGQSFSDITFDLHNHDVGSLGVDASGSVLLAGFEGDSTARLAVGPCTSDAVCNDGLGCTTDTCAPNDPRSDVFGCLHIQPDPDCVEQCTSAAACVTGNLCEIWSCVPGNLDADARGCLLLDYVQCNPSVCHGDFCDRDTGLCVDVPQTGPICDDGDPCTRSDACQAGGCQGDASPLPACDTSIVAGGSTLMIKNKTPDDKDALVFKLKKGPLASVAELGNPFLVGGADYLACLYDHSGPAGSSRLLRSFEAMAGEQCAGAPCWKTLSGSSVRYRNKLGSAVGGIDTIDLTPGGAGATKVTLKAHGTALSPPTGPLSPGVTLQLRRKNSAAVCWGASFSSFIAHNDATLFKAKSD